MIQFKDLPRVLMQVSMEQDGEAALPDGRVRSPVRGGARVLGPRQQPGRTLLLDDLHSGKD